MAFADVFAPALVTVFERLGEFTTYTPAAGVPVACRAIVDRSVAGEDGYPTIVEGRATVSLLLSEVATPRAGARVPAAGATWELVSKAVGDQFHERWTCRRVTS